MKLVFQKKLENLDVESLLAKQEESPISATENSLLAQGQEEQPQEIRG